MHAEPSSYIFGYNAVVRIAPDGSIAVAKAREREEENERERELWPSRRAG